ncbi:MAG: TIGR04282 family arsenosugar biosynthesis glycosyltransferase [Pseudoalteromonas distincta]
MRLSVVIPVLNEAAGIQDALLALQAVRDGVELIVVDGGSTDGTRELAAPLADKVLTSAPGRARQMNAGAAVATGDVLVFLHADTRLPEGFVGMVTAAVAGQAPFAARPPLPPNPNIPNPSSHSSSPGRSGGPAANTQPKLPIPTQTGGSGGPAAKKPHSSDHNTVIPANAGIHLDLPPHCDWGRFDVRLSPSSPMLNLVAWMMNQRSRLTGICTGDQAIFVRRALFEQLGGYADIPLMEDIDLSRRLRKISRAACLRPALTTSSRKWQKHGVLRAICLMWWVRLQYWAGVPPERLVQQYYGAAPASENAAAKPSPRRPQTSRPLLIFAKAPLPGTVKTRLIPALGAEGACQLYQQLLMHTLNQTRDWPGLRYLYCAPDMSHPLFTRLANEHHLQLRQQQGQDLGSRMQQALAEHSGGGLLIGTDCPLISTEALLDADQALKIHDTAIIPSEDGGYVMIGQRQPDPAAFVAMTWSHARVMEDTRSRLATAGKTLWTGPILWDLDEPEDLPRLSDISLPAL